MKFKKLVLYDLKSEPIEKEFVDKLNAFSESVKIVLAEKEYSQRLNVQELAGADALITRLFDAYDDTLFTESSLKYIGAMHTDISHFNKEILTKKGITLTNVPDYATEAVAELTISVLLNISRQTHDAMNFVKEGKWGFEKFMGWEVEGKTMGIIGLGKIGMRVAEIAQCLGMTVVYSSRTMKPGVERKGFKFLQVDELLKQSDVVSLHCTLNNETNNILNKSNMKFMKQDAVLLNSARSELVDLDETYHLCKDKKISAWFEAIEDDEIRARFRQLDNIYLTPHFGWMTKEAQRMLRETTISNIDAYLKDRPQNKVN